MIRKQIKVLMFALILVILGGTSALGQVIYDSTVSPLPGNQLSVGAEAYAFDEFGDGITFAGTSRKLVNVTVTLSSFACQSGNWFSGNCVTTPGATFTLPMTLNIYNAGSPTPGSSITTVTQNITVPYRPSADNANCTDGKWYDSASGYCFNGKAANVVFDFSSLSVVLPNSVVYGIVYNTTHSGASPIGESAPCWGTVAGCPYDALNIALSPTVNVGTKPFFNTVYQNSTVPAEYCDNGLAGLGIFRLDSPTVQCWVGEIPAAKFLASNTPNNKDDCKNGGWQTLTDANGQPFKNQGQCVSSTNH